MSKKSGDVLNSMFKDVEVDEGGKRFLKSGVRFFDVSTSSDVSADTDGDAPVPVGVLPLPLDVVVFVIVDVVAIAVELFVNLLPFNGLVNLRRITPDEDF